jgi:hypothetical protein
LVMPCFLQGVNLVSFLVGEVCVVHGAILDCPGRKAECYRIPPTTSSVKIALHP